MFEALCNQTDVSGMELRAIAERVLLEHSDGARTKRTHLRAQRIAEDAHVRIEQPGGNVSEWRACTVCIARDEVWLLIDTFVHSRSRIRVSLPDRRGVVRELTGSASDSRHVHRRLHCLIVRFDAEVEIEEFLLDQREIDRLRAVECERLPPIEGRVLLVTASSAEMMILSHWLREIGLVCPQVADVQAAVQQVRRTIFDVVLVDLDCIESDPGEVPARLRHAGYKGEIVVMTAGRRQVDCEPIDCTTIAKPVAQPTLVKAVRDAVASASGMTEVAPIRSTLPRSMELDAAVRRFTEEVAEDGRRILQALNQNNIAVARTIVTRLQGAGSMFGYEMLSQCAGEVYEAIASAVSLSEVSKCLHRLASLCERIAADTSRAAA